MGNVSSNGENIIFNPEKEYLFIDALYLQEIKNASNLDDNINLDAIRETVFPYTDTPFTITKLVTSNFDLQQIKTGDKNYLDKSPKSFFSTDTGMILVINTEILADFLPMFSYDELVGSDKEINIPYWQKMVADFKIEDVALILGPGINSGVDLTGSGTFFIQK